MVRYGNIVTDFFGPLGANAPREKLHWVRKIWILILKLNFNEIFYILLLRFKLHELLL